MKTINCRAIPVSRYAMNACQFTKKKLYDLDIMVKATLHRKGMLGRQGGDERLYIKGQEGGRGVKSLKLVYKETKVLVATYVVLSPSHWIRVAWKREYTYKYKSLKKEAEQALREMGLKVHLREEEIWGTEEKVKKDWSVCWKELKKGCEEKLKNKYKEKMMLSQVFVG